MQECLYLDMNGGRYGIVNNKMER